MSLFVKICSLVKKYVICNLRKDFAQLFLFNYFQNYDQNFVLNLLNVTTFPKKILKLFRNWSVFLKFQIKLLEFLLCLQKLL